jgi:cytosine/adenosine deaminase-related metal-dependent hydrolase
VAVREGRVAWVGRSGDPGEPDAPVHDLGPGVLLPGLVNAHCHLELSHLAADLDGLEGYVPWVEGLVAARDARPADAVQAATAAAIRGLEGCGTAAVGDVSNALGHLTLLAESSLEAVVFFELLAWDPAAAPAALEAARRRVAAMGGSRPAPNVEVRVAAHAPHSVSAALFARLVKAGGPAALHLAESPAETRFLADGDAEWSAFLGRRGQGHVAFTPPGTTPVRYADRLGVLHPFLVAAHCVQVDHEDIALLARRQVGIVLCPRSNRRLGVGRAPVPALRAAGVRLALGTDSLASSPDLDVLNDAIALGREFPQLEPSFLVHLATAGGADVLGLPHLGTLAPGQKAALAYAPADRPPADPHEFLLSGEAALRRVDP